jgi:hypothetical protein
MVCHFFLRRLALVMIKTQQPPGGQSSVSIGELWPGINQLDEAGHEGTSAIVM